MVFRTLLTAAQRAALDAERREIARLHGLSDRWLADALLRMAREVRRAHPDRLGDPRGIVYETSFVWHLVPELAKRMGASRLLPNKATDQRFAAADGRELRRLAGIYLRHTALDRWRRPNVAGAERRAGMLPETLLCRAIANGNPVAFAADRICPAPAPGDDRDDWIARHVREVSAHRGLEPTPYWTPAMQARGEHRAADRQQADPEARAVGGDASAPGVFRLR